MRDHEDQKTMVIYLDSVDSTNNYLKDRVTELSHGDAVVAAVQTMGKGRLGRQWESNAGDGLYLSVLMHPSSMEHFTIIPIICGLAVHSAMKLLCGVEIGLKWPNDIILDGRKLGGILCEGRLGRAVCGIGINLNQKSQYFEEKQLPNGISLHMAGVNAPDVKTLAEKIVNELILIYNRLENSGKGEIIAEFKKNCVTLGREVIAHYRDREIRGTAVDINDDGELIVRTDDAEYTVNSGEVKLRIADGAYV